MLERNGCQAKINIVDKPLFGGILLYIIGEMPVGEMTWISEQHWSAGKEWMNAFLN